MIVLFTINFLLKNAYFSSIICLLGSKIEKVCASSKLFAVVGSFGLVIIYERSDDKHDPYIETRRLSLGKEYDDWVI
jgi:hypothetical protein